MSHVRCLVIVEPLNTNDAVKVDYRGIYEWSTKNPLGVWDYYVRGWPRDPEYGLYRRAGARLDRYVCRVRELPPDLGLPFALRYPQPRTVVRSGSTSISWRGVTRRTLPRLRPGMRRRWPRTRITSW
jgi:hypothetical protein